MRFFLLSTLVLLALEFPGAALAGDNPTETVREAEQVLVEIMAIPARAIPERLLADAQGVAIIPNVIKIGFIAGARRGHGVVMVRDNDGEWGLPQFVILTGGSVGWQAGIQGSDIVLVFMTKKGVEGLLTGKFTIGVDVAAAAGPVGRNAAAATDERLKAEILSYSRSRGLFLGASIDGSVIEVDRLAHESYYASLANELPRQVPADAINLRQELSNMTGVPVPVAAGSPPVGAAPSSAPPVIPFAPNPGRLEIERRAIVQHAGRLHALLSPEWRQYLAVPKEFVDGGQPRLDQLEMCIKRYDQIAASPNYRELAGRPEFQSTHELLREYLQGMAGSSPSFLQLPPPPNG